MAEEVPVDATLKELMSSLSSLETTLEPLMKHKFADLQEQMAKEPVARARLEILTAYAVHDLMWSTCSSFCSTSCTSLTGSRMSHSLLEDVGSQHGRSSSQG